MKKFMLALAAVAATFTASAQELVKTLYAGDPVTVTWETPASLGPELFTSEIAAGHFINFKFTATEDVFELKSNGKWLPGSTFVALGTDRADLRVYITEDMLAALKAHGLEVVGKNFTYNAVEICNDGFKMPEGAVWGGYFWMDSWTTIDIRKTALDNYKGQRYLDLYFDRSQDADNTNYLVNVRTSWNDDGIVAENAAIKKEPMRATVDLQNIDLPALLTKGDNLMVQCNKEGGSPFNLTAVALRHDQNVTSVSEVGINVVSDTKVYNLMGVPVAPSLEAAQTTLPAGIYICNGRKYVVK